VLPEAERRIVAGGSRKLVGETGRFCRVRQILRRVQRSSVPALRIRSRSANVAADRAYESVPNFRKVLGTTPARYMGERYAAPGRTSS